MAGLFIVDCPEGIGGRNSPNMPPIKEEKPVAKWIIQLSDVKVKNAKPRKTEYEVLDDGRLDFLVAPPLPLLQILAFQVSLLGKARGVLTPLTMCLSQQCGLS